MLLLSRPLFVVQLAVVITLTLGCPLNFLIMKCTIKSEHSETKDILLKTDIVSEIKQKILKNSWDLDLKKPRALLYIDEFVMKPLMIRDYHARK